MLQPCQRDAFFQMQSRNTRLEKSEVLRFKRVGSAHDDDARVRVRPRNGGQSLYENVHALPSLQSSHDADQRAIGREAKTGARVAGRGQVGRRETFKFHAGKYHAHGARRPQKFALHLRDHLRTGQNPARGQARCQPIHNVTRRAAELIPEGGKARQASGQAAVYLPHRHPAQNDIGLKAARNRRNANHCGRGLMRPA